MKFCKHLAMLLLAVTLLFAACDDGGSGGGGGTTPLTDTEAGTTDTSSLEIGPDGVDLSNIESDLVLPTEGDNGTTITWSASPEGVVNTDDGTVTRPAWNDQDVTLTATVTKGSESEVKDFTLTVKSTDLGYATVTYHANGGTGGTVPTDTGEYNNGDSVTVSDNTGNLVGALVGGDHTGSGIKQRFIGWNTDSGATTAQYEAGATYSITDNITLYAIYTTGTDVLRKVGPAGGWLFYDHGSNPGWGRYLEAWTADESEALQWKTSTSSTAGTSTAIGSGKANTGYTIEGVTTGMTGDEHPAAKVVREATHGGFNDWFLPSRAELNEMYDNLHIEGVGGFGSDYYWSSSESNASNAWRQYFLDGFLYGSGKLKTGRVRAVRAF